jgi:hypothetical protein
MSFQAGSLEDNVLSFKKMNQKCGYA